MKIEDYNKYYIQGSDHYLIPKDVFKELFNEMINWKEENKQLKDNWNKLKEYLFDIRKRGFALQNLANVTKNTEPGIAILIIINKMQELERSDSNGQ